MGIAGDGRFGRLTRSTLVSPARRRALHRGRRWITRHVPGDRELPSYFIIGTKRGGTTSLNEYLNQHPLVARGLVEKGCRYFDINYDRGWDWFCGNFPTKRAIDRRERMLGARPIIGESSPYYCFHPDAPWRIAARFPDARLLICLRDPVARAWSQYQYERKRGFETLSFGDALDAESERLTSGTPDERAFAHRHFAYVARGRYAEQLEAIWEHFDRQQLLIIESERLFSAPDEVLAEAHEHLGLPPYAGDYAKAHKQNSYEGLDDALRARLEAIYREPNDRLRGLIGDRMSWL